MNKISKIILKLFPSFGDILSEKIVDFKKNKKIDKFKNTTDDKKKYKGTDIGAYHQRYDLGNKISFIHDFINKSDIKTVVDIGCNSGAISKNLLQEVTGYDLTPQKDLNHAKNYKYKQIDIINQDVIQERDCTLFLSVYHHILVHEGLEKADQVFYKLLFKSDYLIFDSGGPDEKESKYWVKKLRKYFTSYEKLLDHFNVPYKILGSWEIGGAKRTIVVFSKKDAVNSLTLIAEYRRFIGTKNRKKGLILVSQCSEYDDSTIYKNVRFFQLKLGNMDFFGKKHLKQEDMIKEFQNTKQVFEEIPSEKLLLFYGKTEKFGLLFPYLKMDDFKILKKPVQLRLSDKNLEDVNQIVIDGNIYYIDFER